MFTPDLIKGGGDQLHRKQLDIQFFHWNLQQQSSLV